MGFFAAMLPALATAGKALGKDVLEGTKQSIASPQAYGAKPAPQEAGGAPGGDPQAGQQQNVAHMLFSHLLNPKPAPTGPTPSTPVPGAPQQQPDATKPNFGMFPTLPY